MASAWKYFCCDCCDIADDKRTRGSARYKLHKSNKNTWTRRKLLQADDETNCLHGDQIAYQMGTITDTPVRDLDDDFEEACKDRILEHFAPKKRPAIHDVFDTTNENATDVAKTTFPWMDDRFVPNGRSRTRLGISSVQMNAKRTEVRNNLVNENVNVNRRMDKTGRNNVYEQPNHGINLQTNRNNYQLMNSYSDQTNVKQNGQVIRNNIVTAPKSTTANKQQHVHHVVNNNSSNRPMVFKESASDVGVRRINPNSHQTKPNRIPKLEDYSNVIGTRYFKDSSSDIGPYRPKNHAAFHKVCGSNEGDVSFSSEVTFRQNPSTDTSSDLSMKRSSVPGIFSSKTTKYDQIKSAKGKPKSRHDKSMTDSMYGYIPKVVQDVQASNALEGAQIDDYFMKLFQERKMDKFGLLENAEEESENVPVIITTVGSIEDLTKESAKHTSPVEMDSIQCGQNMSQLINGGQKQATIMVNTKRRTETDTTFSDIKVNGKLQNSDAVDTSADKTDESEDKIIMIDFPPNPEIDKKVAAVNIKLSQTTISPLPTNMIKLNANNSIAKRDEVLY